MSKFLIGNLKMNMTKTEIVSYLKGLKKQAKKYDNKVGVVLPFPYLYLAEKYLAKSNVCYGAQNVNDHRKGAYTGEVSVDMLNDFGVQLVLVGHSERRAYYNENDTAINTKIKSLLDHKITPVFCFGENLEQREKGEQNKTVDKQIINALKDIERDEIEKIIFAYEPVWAIGTGVSATSEQAEKMAEHIKDFVAKQYTMQKDKICVVYGGSLNDKNANEILSLPSIDGGLIGGACLKVETFEKIFSYK